MEETKKKKYFLCEILEMDEQETSCEVDFN